MGKISMRRYKKSVADAEFLEALDRAERKKKAKESLDEFRDLRIKLVEMHRESMVAHREHSEWINERIGYANDLLDTIQLEN